MRPSLETLRRQVEAPMRQHGVVHAGAFGSAARDVPVHAYFRVDRELAWEVKHERIRSLPEDDETRTFDDTAITSYRPAMTFVDATAPAEPA